MINLWSRPRHTSRPDGRSRRCDKTARRVASASALHGPTQRARPDVIATRQPSVTHLQTWNRKLTKAEINCSGGAIPGRDTSNDLAGRSTALAPPCLLLCFGNSMLDCYIVSGVGGLCFQGDDYKRSSTFLGKKCIRWPGLRTLWTRNDLAMRWRLHPMTCLTTLVTWRWPGCLDVLAPPLINWKIFCSFFLSTCTSTRSDKTV